MDFLINPDLTMIKNPATNLMNPFLLAVVGTSIPIF